MSTRQVMENGKLVTVRVVNVDGQEHNIDAATTPQREMQIINEIRQENLAAKAKQAPQGMAIPQGVPTAKPAGSTRTLVQGPEEGSLPGGRPTNMQVLKDGLKAGVTGVADLGNVATAGIDAIVRLGGVPPAYGGYEQRKQSIDMFNKENLGTDPTLDARMTPVQRVMHSVAKVPLDLSTYVGGSLLKGGVAAGQAAAQSVKSKAMEMFGKFLGDATTGAAAAAGSTSAVEGLKGAGVDNQLALGAAGLAGGVGAATVAPFTPSRMAIRAGQSAMQNKEGISQGVQDGVQSAANALGNAKVANTLKQAVQDDPNLLTTLRESTEVGKRLGINLPTVAAAGDPSVLVQKGKELASSGARGSDGVSFRAKQEAAIREADTGLRQNILDKVGDATKLSNQVEARTVMKTQQLNAGVALSERKYNEAIDNTTAMIRNLSDKPNAGAAVARIADAQEGLAKAKFKPEYAQLSDDIQGSGFQFSPETVNGMIDSGQILQRQNFMDLLPVEARRAMTKLTDTVDGGVGLSFTDFDEIKRGVNRVLRETEPGSRENLIMQRFRDEVVNPARASLPPKLAKRYDDLDTRYFESIGLKFGQQGIKDIGSARYNQDIVPRLARNPEALEHFIKVGGEEGMQAARDVMLAQLKHQDVKPEKLADWVRKNDQQLSLIPGLKEELSGQAGLVAGLAEAKAKAIAAQSDYITNDIMGKTGGSVERAFQKLLKDPQALADTLKRYGGSSQTGMVDTLQAIRSVAFEQILDNPGMLGAIKASKEQQRNLTKIMGPDFVQQMNDVMQVAPMLKNSLDAAFSNKAAIQDGFQEMFGITVPSFISKVMNRIAGVVTTTADIGRTVVLAKGKQASDRLLTDFLAGSQGRQALLDAAEKAKSSDGKTIDAAKFLTNISEDSRSKGIIAFIKKTASEAAEGSVGPTMSSTASAVDSAGEREQFRPSDNPLIDPFAEDTPVATPTQQEPAQ
jgi:hypothetical protein